MNLFLTIFVLIFHLTYGHSNRQVREILDQIHSESSDHYDGTTIGAFEEKRLHKRDASDDDTKELTLETPSGTVRMHLKKRSVDLSGSNFYSLIDGLLEEIEYRPEDCFYSHDVDIDPSIRGTFSFCRGIMRGSVEIAGRHIDVMQLPDELLFLNNEDKEYVLLRWKDAPELDPAEQPGLPVSEEWSDVVEATGLPPVSEFGQGNDTWGDDEIFVNETEDSIRYKRRARKNRKNRKNRKKKPVYIPPPDTTEVTVEIADYLDKWYVAKLRRNLLRSRKGTTTKDIIDFMIRKWAGVANVFSHPKIFGRNIKLRLVHLEIWEKENPSWYRQSIDGIGRSMKIICNNTQHLKVDHVMIHTGNTNDLAKAGVAIGTGACRPRARCAVVRLYSMSHHVEAHELGHNLGLGHDYQMNECKTDKTPDGFMSKYRDIVRPCYGQRLRYAFRKKNLQCLFRIDYQGKPIRTF